MYIPRHFLATDQEELIAFMQKYSFATLVSAENNIPLATHLPFLVRKIDDRIILSSHFARANPQASSITGADILVIFSEPHAYISPRYYEKEENVPTWNYLAVHAYGRAAIIDDEAGKLSLMERTISNYEVEYLDQWSRLSDAYKIRMLKGIVAFDVVVSDLQGKKKLSQNKTAVERENIIGAFSQSTDSNEVQIAEYMKQNQQ